MGSIPYPKAFGLGHTTKTLAEFVDGMPLDFVANRSAAPPEYVFGDRKLELLSRDVGRVRASQYASSTPTLILMMSLKYWLLSSIDVSLTALRTWQATFSIMATK